MQDNKKRFSIRTRMMLIFGILIIVALVLLAFLSIRYAKEGIMESVKAHLTDKAGEVAKRLDGYNREWFEFLDGIAKEPILHDEHTTYLEKARVLKTMADADDSLMKLDIMDRDGIWYLANGTITDTSMQDWYLDSNRGENRVFSAPLIDLETGKLICCISVPILGENNKVIDILCGVIDGLELCNNIDDITVGKTGGCFIIDSSGTTIAHKDRDRVISQENTIKKAKADSSFKPIGDYMQKVLNANETTVDYYQFAGVSDIACAAKMETTGWSIVVKAPVNEFLDSIDKMRLSIIITGIVLTLVILAMVFLVASQIVKPINYAVTTLQDIAQGDGDLTVRLPVEGNDEITDMAEYFNETISKIAASVRSVEASAHTMQEIGTDLSSNMTETASAVNQISANIEGLKGQTITQAASVTETSATMEEIIRTIKNLNGSIETQVASVAQSSSSIEEMAANIASITQNISKSDEAVNRLADATDDGKKTVSNASSSMQKIAEESGSLIEASNVIQNIASQTNLLAMNAAIEAAHAGESGKGFAVVADEIRKLAEESSVQGKTITGTLKSLSAEIQGVADSAKLVGEKFNVIYELSEEVKKTSKILTQAMQEQENGSREILSAIKNINSVTLEVKDGSAEMLKGGEQVAQEMKKLDELTRLVSDSMNEMAAGAAQINNAVQEVDEITQKNKQAVERLIAEVGKFKVN